MDTKTLEQVRAEFQFKGITWRSWCKEHGIYYSSFVNVMNGRDKGLWGRGHNISVLLGLKKGEVNPAIPMQPPTTKQETSHDL